MTKSSIGLDPAKTTPGLLAQATDNRRADWVRFSAVKAMLPDGYYIEDVAKWLGWEVARAREAMNEAKRNGTPEG